MGEIILHSSDMTEILPLQERCIITTLSLRDDHVSMIYNDNDIQLEEIGSLKSRVKMNILEPLT